MEALNAECTKMYMARSGQGQREGTETVRGDGGGAGCGKQKCQKQCTLHELFSADRPAVAVRSWTFSA